MPTKLARWGNSLALRINRNICEGANLQADDQMYIRLLDSGDILVRAAKPRAIPDGYKVPDKEALREPTDAEILAQW